jgi:hypothetical protein
MYYIKKQPFISPTFLKPQIHMQQHENCIFSMWSMPHKGNVGYSHNFLFPEPVGCSSRYSKTLVLINQMTWYHIPVHLEGASPSDSDADCYTNAKKDTIS